MNVLVTGGAGYIGSHTCVELPESGYGEQNFKLVRKFAPAFSIKSSR